MSAWVPQGLFLQIGIPFVAVLIIRAGPVIVGNSHRALGSSAHTETRKYSENGKPSNLRKKCPACSYVPCCMLHGITTYQLTPYYVIPKMFCCYVLFMLYALLSATTYYIVLHSSVLYYTAFCYISSHFVTL